MEEINISDSVEKVNQELSKIFKLLGFLNTLKGKYSNKNSLKALKKGEYILANQLSLLNTLVGFPNWNVNDITIRKYLDELLKFPYAVKLSEIRKSKRNIEYFPNPLFFNNLQMFERLRMDLESCLICQTPQTVFRFSDLIIEMLERFKDYFSNKLKTLMEKESVSFNISLSDLRKEKIESRKGRNKEIFIHFSCSGNLCEDYLMGLCEKQYIWFLIFQDLLKNFDPIIDKNRIYPHSLSRNITDGDCGIKISFVATRDEV